MPAEEYQWLPRLHILDFEELAVLVEAFVGLGVDRVRLTGGEPLLRRDLERFVALLAAQPGLNDIALTTNGVLLKERALGLMQAGLHRLTISLDTLQSDRFQQLTRRDDLSRVFEGIEEVVRLGMSGLKIDSVIMRGTNEDELGDLIEAGKRWGAEVRFIEYMDVGGATEWSMEKVVSVDEMLQKLTAIYGDIEVLAEGGSAPAQRYALPDGTVFGVIASTTVPFCSTCDRSRITADGTWYTCLYARGGVDLRALLRSGATAEDLRRVLTGTWRERNDRGAEDRLETQARGASVHPDDLAQDPRLEMHTRGG
jgi:cyclic pyranopterin phosphate synthase